ncbi:MAG: hypothetical protein ACOC7T_05140 [Planctomycetota bacterium]
MSIRTRRSGRFSIVLLLVSVVFFGAGVSARGAAAGAPPEMLAHLTNPGEGWTAFQPASDTRMVFVSSSQGEDSNDGLSPGRPLKTIAKGLARLRNDHSDWLLLKRGDVWRGSIGMITANRLKNGRSPEQPTLIASYGAAGARPLLKLGDAGNGLRVAVNRPAKARNMAVVGIHFYDEKGDPGSEEFVEDREKDGAGIAWAAPGENLLIEDCRFRYVSGGAVVGRSPWKGTPDDELRNVKVRRCVATHAWSTSGHCQGFFFSKVKGLVLEENVLDHNGYSIETGDLPTWFNHNVYITTDCDDVVARGNIVARGSTTGIYCRTNGVLEGNLCLDNTPSLNLGRIRKARPGGVTGRVTGNVVIDAAPRTNEKRTIRGNGIEVGNVNTEGVVVENNILIGASESPGALSIGPAGVGVHNAVFRHNTVYNWSRAFSVIGVHSRQLQKLQISGNRFEHNLIQNPGREQMGLIRVRDMAEPRGVAFGRNLYWSGAERAEWFLVGAGDRRTVGVDFEEWSQRARDTASRVERVRFADPARTAATYHATLGGQATRQAFLAEAARQSKFNWRPQYTAAAVIEYIREGFRPLRDVQGAGAVEPSAP